MNVLTVYYPTCIQFKPTYVHDLIISVSPYRSGLSGSLWLRVFYEVVSKLSSTVDHGAFASKFTYMCLSTGFLMTQCDKAAGFPHKQLVQKRIGWHPRWKLQSLCSLIFGVMSRYTFSVGSDSSKPSWHSRGGDFSVWMPGGRAPQGSPWRLPSTTALLLFLNICDTSTEACNKLVHQ